MKNRLALTFGLAALALFMLCLVIVRIILIDGDNYAYKVYAQQNYTSTTLTAERGKIYDRNGTVLATNEKVYTLVIDPKVILSDEDYIDCTVQALCDVYGFDKDKLTEDIKARADSSYYVISDYKYLSEEMMQKFEDYRTEYNSKEAVGEGETQSEKYTTPVKTSSAYKIKGVWFEESYKRVYPYDSLASSVLGFASADGTSGSYGIEQYYNSTLVGTNGRSYGYVNDSDNVQRTTIAAVNGESVVSTLDAYIQSVVEEALDDFMDSIGASGVHIAAMDPQTGEILAMANYPQDYNLNDPTNMEGILDDDIVEALTTTDTDYQMSEETMTKIETILSNVKGTTTFANARTTRSEDEKGKLTAEEKAEIRAYVWSNYAISGYYEPGSVAKAFTLCEAIDEGIVKADDQWYCDGGQTIGSWFLRCHKTAGHGSISTTYAFEVSCNDALMQVAAKIGATSFCKFQHTIGLGMTTGIDLPGEISCSGLQYTEDNCDAVALATNAFGQNYDVTMVQMLGAYASLVNGGNYYIPHVVKQILDDQGNVTKTISPTLVRRTISESTTEWFNNAMRLTVEEGTGEYIQIEGYDIGGKSGTAEKYPRGNGKYITSFMSACPMDDPQILLYVLIDESADYDGEATSENAQHVSHAIYEKILPYLGITKTTSTEENTDSSSSTASDSTDTTADTTSSAAQTSSAAADEDDRSDTYTDNGGLFGGAAGADSILSNPVVQTTEAVEE